jgi:hypothetical protein
MLETLFPYQIFQRNSKTICLLALFLITSCKSISQSSSPSITKQEAMEVAIEIASMSRPEIDGLQGEISNIHAEQMTLDEAVKKIDERNQPSSLYDPNMMVWFITMDGLWLGGMSIPDAVTTPTPVPYHHYAIILDAKTGAEIESTLTP